MPSSDQLPRFTALLFGLSGGLVDFGARTLSLALLRSHPHSPAEHLRDASLLPFAKAQSFLLRRKPNKSERQRLEQALDEAAGEQAEAIAGAVALLESLDEQRIPYAWQDELPESVCQRLAAPLGRADALIPRLGIERLDGCVLVSAQPRQLQAGLNAGLWTIGLAASGPSCGLSPADWDALGHTERDRLRADATLELYRLGVHSVIDHLGELQPCLHDLAVRRLKGEKP
ncbi:phosphatase/phosphohexomutase-like protein [Pseudomonas aeruginosa VRFPA03]|nr:phosphatase/phosphohexomutase-like protein [Pseudomonas aeruginosa VRFPA03]